MKIIIKFSIITAFALSLFGCSSSQSVVTQPVKPTSSVESSLTPEQQDLLVVLKQDVQDDDAFTKVCELAEQGDTFGAMKVLGQIDKQSTQLRLSAFGSNDQEIINNFRNRKHDDGLSCSQYIVVTQHPELR